MHGLSQAEAQRRLRTDGTNELPAATQRNILAIMLEVVREPMFLLLVGCGAIYLRARRYQRSADAAGFVFVVIGITFYQERKTERALEALRDLSSPRALVIRDGSRTAHRRARGGARRPAAPGRGRPRAGRCGAGVPATISRWTNRC